MGRASFSAFVGRRRESARLDALFRELTSGRNSIVVIEGEAGIGKSRLVDAFLTTARGDAHGVHLGHAYELEQTRPFAAIAEALGCDRPTADPRRQPIAALLSPSLDEAPVTSASDPGRQYRIVDALVTLVEEEAVLGPVVVVIEDLHWADPATVATLDAMARRLRALPVMLVGTVRAVPRPPALAAFLTGLDRLGTVRVGLGPLDERASARLVGGVLGMEVGATLRERLAAAGGNPMYLIELAAALAADGSIEERDGAAELTDVRLPASLREAILRRMSFLPEETLHVLRLAAVLGTSFSVDQLATTAGTTAAVLARLLRPALQARMIEDRQSSLGFHHELLREAVYDDLPEGLRAAMHREAASRLAESGEPASIVAEHFWRGRREDDDEALAWLADAAAEAATRSPAAAVELLDRAIAVAAPTSPRHGQLAVQRAACLLWTGRLVEAAAAARTALAADLDPRLRAEASCWLGLALLGSGQVADAGTVFAEAAASQGSLDDTDAARLLAYAAQARVMLPDLPGAAQAAETARARADAAGDLLAACLATTASTFATFARGHFGEALHLAEEGVRLADRSPDRVGHRFQMELFRANCLVDTDHIPDALLAMQRGLQLCAELGNRWNLPLHHTSLAALHFVSGDWDDALADCATALELADEAGTEFGNAYTLTLQALIALHRDDLGLSRQLLKAAEAEQRRVGLQYRADWTWWTRALLLEADGKLENACTTLESVWDMAGALDFVCELPILGPDLARLAIATGKRDRAVQVACTLEDLMSREDFPWVAGSALRCRGVADDDADVLLAAVDCYARTTRPLDAAHARELAAGALRRAGRSTDAQTLLAEALDIHAALGATRGVGRVTAALRSMGVRLGARGPRVRPKSGWKSLTATESRVVALVAEGLSNPQIGARLFISPRTVQTHLFHVFPKLGVSTRAELAVAAARRQDTTGG